MENQLLSNILIHLKKNFLTLLLVFLAGISNGVMDTLQFHFGKSIFQDATKFEVEFWNPDISWKNKYKDYPKDKSPKFPGATTLFVGLTDGWHFFQAVMLFCFLLAIICYKNHKSFLISLMAMIILFGAFSFGFTLMYDLFLI